jgi:AcrR family transcriptional regulator
VYARRVELYARAMPVFELHGYRGSTLKALAHASGLSIPGIYRYFPSKRAFALFPLRALYPALHPPDPNPADFNAVDYLAIWVEAASSTSRANVLAVRLALETGLTDEEQRRNEVNLARHIDGLAGAVERASPRLRPEAARQVAATMVDLALARALTGIAPDARQLRRDLVVLLRSYGIDVTRPGQPADAPWSSTRRSKPRDAGA